MFKYHHICRNDNQTFCFYDENYFCLCDEDHYRADCFILGIEYDQCSKCLSGGKCVQGDLKDPNDFICLCPSCYYGHKCEFNSAAFGFTLDSLLISESKQVKIVYVCLVALLFIIGFFNNLCSFVTFIRPSPRKFATGIYLLIVTCLNQFVLMCLLLKFIQIRFGFSDIGSCKVVSYLLSVLTRSIYWLTSWISVDRFLLIVYPTSVMLRTSCVSIVVSVITLIILFGVHVHEIIYYTIIENYSTGSSICVANFSTSFVTTYNRMSTPIHYLLTFSIQTISVTFLIVLAARSRKRATGEKVTFHQMLKKQFETQKELYVTPAIIIISVSLQAIVTFVFSCKELTGWQRHTLLGAYLLSYAPQTLGFIFYVLPSTNYKKEFYETFIGKRSSKLMLNKKKRKANILKAKT